MTDAAYEAEQPLAADGCSPDRDAAFSAFVRQRGPDLVHLALALAAGDRTQADDLVQGALVRVYLRWHRIESSPYAYARQAVLNQRIDSWRRTRREVLTPTEGFAELRDTNLQTPLPDVHVLAALRALPMRWRRVVVLRYLLDLSEADVAQILGMPIGTVKSAGKRGLDRMRNALETEGVKRSVDRRSNEEGQ